MLMLVLDSALKNIPIMSLQSGGALGSTAEPIIDPRKLQIVAFYVNGQRIKEASVIHTSDIRELGPLGFIVDSAQSIMPLDDQLIRLQEVVKLKFSLIGKQVIDDTKRKIGKVSEYTVESEGFFVQKIHVTQSLLKNFSNSNVIIHRSQIIELTDNVIIVRSGAIPQASGLMQVINPFRKTSSLAADQTKTNSD